MENTLAFTKISSLIFLAFGIVKAPQDSASSHWSDSMGYVKSWDKSEARRGISFTHPVFRLFVEMTCPTQYNIQAISVLYNSRSTVVLGRRQILTPFRGEMLNNDREVACDVMVTGAVMGRRATHGGDFETY
jgi:hypothetical protein